MATAVFLVEKPNGQCPVALTVVVVVVDIAVNYFIFLT